MVILAHGLLKRGIARQDRALAPQKAAESGPRPETIPPLLTAAMLVFLAGGMVVTAAWYGSHESSLPRTPAWTLHRPEDSSPDFPGLTGYPVAEITRITLHAEKGWSIGWTLPEGPALRLFYFEYPRGDSYDQLAVHRPEVCMPASGFTLEDTLPPVTVDVQGIRLAFLHYRFRSLAARLNVFFCIWESGYAPDAAGLGIRSWQDRFRAALQGRRRSQEHKTVELFLTGAKNDDDAVAALKSAVEKLILPR